MMFHESTAVIALTPGMVVMVVMASMVVTDTMVTKKRKQFQRRMRLLTRKVTNTAHEAGKDRLRRYPLSLFTCCR